MRCGYPRRSHALVAALAFLASGATGVAAQELPLFDAHIHYSRDAWERYPPSEIIRLLDQAGIRRALVSSTPDEGTWRLHRQAPDRIVPLLRLYRDSGDVSRWQRDASLIGPMEKELSIRPYKGIGEVHLDAADVDSPVVRRAVDLATSRGMIVEVHTDQAGMEALGERYPTARFMWAHAGLGASAAAVRSVVERFPTLLVELSLRSDVAPGGLLDPEWRATFLAFADRFFLGTDTWIPSRWDSLVETARFNRAWLRQLPPEAAEKIAFRNAERLF